MTSALRKTGWVLITIGAVLMFLLAGRYFGLDLESEAANPDVTAHTTSHPRVSHFR